MATWYAKGFNKNHLLSATNNVNINSLSFTRKRYSDFVAIL